ncbi:MAG: L-seryl-tRNA(Sec) selenium transferase [Armatimonadetes bacterium]|nr:L-seryl-tRNA(Sec) selenium transferase [Anaerolineae bacterium]
MTTNLHSQLRALPSVDKLLAHADGQALIERYGREATLSALREMLDAARGRLRAGAAAVIDVEALLGQAAGQLSIAFRPTLRPVINATGVIIHTNLGRAPLSDAAQRALLAAAGEYSTLEYDLETGKRGTRLLHAGALLAQLTGAEAALVVNNNAAATVLMLAALARRKQVIVSRGELVEIGGGFRVPDIMRQSGARLVEVGTTNRTRAADYERAITPETALLMRVHSSNFKQIGFTESAPLPALAEIAHRHGIYLVDDIGSGALLPTDAFGLDPEPTVQASLAAGVDLVAFSGDKLLGGPQAGILVGKRVLIDQLKRYPLARAVRADKLCLAALCATLDHYRKGEALTHIPVWQMIARSLAELHATAQRWAAALPLYDGVTVDVVQSTSTVGGGSLPGATLPTWVLRVRVAHPDAFTARLRAVQTPVIARIEDDAVLFDPRTVFSMQDTMLLRIIAEALNHAD